MDVKVENLDHLGIVAGIIDEIGIVELIDEQVGQHSQQKVSTGQAVKAMILNGLGFVSAPLYLYADFFQGKATEHLLGTGITAEMLNDDLLGRTLDRIYERGIEQIFSLTAMAAYKKFGLQSQSYHLDSTSISVQGAYESEEEEKEKVEKEEKDNNSTKGKEESFPQPVKITYGYSRDRRPDLKQFMVDMICSGDGGVPLALNLGNGNQSDQEVFAQRIVTFREQWDFEGLFVADSALYSEENLQKLGSLQWLTRVPLTIKQAQELVEDLTQEAFQSCEREGYRWASVDSEYAQIPQRWLVFESEKSRSQALKSLEKKLKKTEAGVLRQAKQLAKVEFECHDDALKQGQQLGKNWQYHQVQSVEVEVKSHHGKRGRPKTTEQPQRVTYHVKVEVVLNNDAVAKAQRKAGRFILATNVSDEQELGVEELLTRYKQQQYSERGWRFLKDPLFFTSSVFLKTPQRIMVLAMVMALALMVYTLAQRQLRQALLLTEQTVPDQRKRPTQAPTIRWIFQCFQSIHVLWLEGRRLISNLTDFHLQVLGLLGPPCQKYYCLS
jgi:transposase